MYLLDAAGSLHGGVYPWLSCAGTEATATLLMATLLCACADPILAYSAGAEVNQLQWSNTQPDWVAICFSNKTQILRV